MTEEREQVMTGEQPASASGDGQSAGHRRAGFFGSTPLDLPLAIAAALSVVLLVRMVGAPMQPYGSDSAQYIEHLTRMETLQAWAEPGDEGLLGFLRRADGAFPPLMHLVTLLAGKASGHAAEHILWTGLLWLQLLALSVGVAAALVVGSRRAGAAAYCGTLLLPAAHAFATRYYYDLPMTAVLWLAIPVVLLTWDRRPLLGGLLVALVLFAADLVKWTALPFGWLMVAAAAATPRVLWDGTRQFVLRRRALGLATALVVSSLLVLAFVQVAGPYDSFTAMLGEIGDRGEDGAPTGVDSSDVDGVLANLLSGMQPLSSQRLAFYPVRLIASVFSPVVFLVVVALGLLWGLRDRRGWVLILGTVLGQWAFLLLRVPPVDDRFVLTLAPALVLAAALGWDHLQLRSRWCVGGLAVVLGFAVAVDFHFGDPVQKTPTMSRPGHESFSELIRWGLADSADQRGWARRDSQPSNRSAVRDDLWGVLRQCEATQWRLRAEDALVGDSGDVYWFRYRTLLAYLVEGEPRRDVPPMCDDPPEGEVQMALTGVRRGTPPLRPSCLSDEVWHLEGVVALAAGPRDVAIWAPREQQACPALSMGWSSPHREADALVPGESSPVSGEEGHDAGGASP